MKKTLLKTTTLLFLVMLWASTTLMAQVNMNRYIILTVVDGADISLELAADADNTPVQIVSGTNIYEIAVGTDWEGGQYTAGATTMTVYGNIQQFSCSGNEENITGVELTGNRDLTYLYCSENQLSSLDVSGCVALLELECYFNQLSSLDLSGCVDLLKLKCDNNQLSNLDVSGCTALSWFYCYDNRLSSLDVSNNVALTQFWCYNNQLTSLDVSNCTALSWFHCHMNQLNSINVSGCSDLSSFGCSDNQLSTLDVSGCANLYMLLCINNALTSLDVSNCMNLESIACYGNPLGTQAIDDIYCALSDRTGLGDGVISPLNNTLDANYADVLVSNGQNARDKNWKVWYFDNDTGSLHNTDIPTTGTYECGSNISVTDVSVSPASVSLRQGETAQLTATVAPANATNQNVTWSSQDESVATVDENGLVTGVALNGKTTITVTTEDGNFTAVCQVEAYDAIEELSLSNIAKVYPNPVYETLYIEPQTTSDFIVELYNTHGQLVLQSQNNTTISVTDLPKGVYMLKLTIDQQVYSTKVVK